ncbi:unnamed protein product [Pleuronectes platessa]|uniref:Uncharacterized protein n=1 Tax=Pleuronectes platessa TaxID=8262 RepID=A0A9N7TL59_PLEPL|nr:unnamed protein product [Pleuronectes platessa]
MSTWSHREDQQQQNNPQIGADDESTIQQENRRLLIVAHVTAEMVRLTRHEKEKYFLTASGEKEPFPSLHDPHSRELSVVVPAYNEELRMPVMLDEAMEYLENRQVSAQLHIDRFPYRWGRSKKRRQVGGGRSKKRRQERGRSRKRRQEAGGRREGRRQEGGWEEVKNAWVALRSIGKKSLEVEAAKCAKLTDVFGAGFTSPAAAGAPGDERGGLDNDERVEADMIALRSVAPPPASRTRSERHSESRARSRGAASQ